MKKDILIEYHMIKMEMLFIHRVVIMNREKVFYQGEIQWIIKEFKCYRYLKMNKYRLLSRLIYRIQIQNKEQRMIDVKIIIIIK